MVQVIEDPYSGNIFGRLGAGIGQGLSEQLPKEIERTRLASGLKNLNQEKVQDPFEFFTKAIGIPGITPQMVQSLGELSKQRLQAQALRGMRNEGQNVKIPGAKIASELPNESEAPSITTRAPIEATIKPFIPRTQEQLLSDASRTFEENPAYFKFDPNAAVEFERSKDAQEQARSQALQAQRQTQQDVQKLITSDLQVQHSKLGGVVPSEVYNRLEDKAINAVKSIAEGGEGLTEQQAIKKYGNELNEISKDYSQLRGLGRLSQFEKGAPEVRRVLKNIQRDLAKRGEEEFFAKILQTSNKLSPSFAYDLAYPVSNTPKLENYIKNLPSLVPSGREPIIPLRERQKKTEKILPELTHTMSQKSGPIAIANALAQKGYDPDVFMNYLENNQDKLLTPEQARQLKEGRNALPSLQDFYLQALAE